MNLLDIFIILSALSAKRKTNYSINLNAEKRKRRKVKEKSQFYVFDSNFRSVTI